MSTDCPVIVDTSALVAIFNDEPDADIYAGAIAAEPLCRLSAASFLEAAIVLDRRRSSVPGRNLDRLLHDADIAIEPVTETQARIARQAYRDFGRGSGHPARLNFGDCFAYALARERDEPLLFKGDDFTLVDVTPAVTRTV
jgi:ribonuclease VapC